MNLIKVGTFSGGLTYTINYVNGKGADNLDTGKREGFPRKPFPIYILDFRV